MKSLTYEELEPVFHKVLRKYCNRKYEMAELIHEIWLMGKVQTLPDIRLAYMSITNSAIDYMRRQDGRIRGGKPTAKKRMRMHSINRSYADNERDISFEEQNRCDRPSDPVLVAIDSEVRAQMIKGLNIRERLILSMRLDGFTFDEIASVSGYNVSRLYQINRAMVGRLQRKIHAIAV